MLGANNSKNLRRFMKNLAKQHESQKFQTTEIWNCTVYNKSYYSAFYFPFSAVLLVTHGVSEHSGKYEPLAIFLNEHKYAVYSHDHG